MTTQPGRQEQSNKQAERANVLWRSYLTGDHSLLETKVRVARRVLKHLPSEPRCRVCNAPFHGLGGMFVSLLGFGAGRSRFNPSLCDRCEKIVKKFQAGAEVELTMLFVDVRGSTKLAEEIGASAFHHLINRFYQASVDVLVASDAMIDKLIGDAVVALYVPGIAGQNHARKAVEAARSLLESVGYGSADGPWIQVGAGVHTGTVYIGAVGSSNSVSDITVLGDAANTTARLASQAGPGEILVSEDTCRSAKLNADSWDPRTLKLKGRGQPVGVRVLPVSA